MHSLLDALCTFEIGEHSINLPGIVEWAYNTSVASWRLAWSTWVMFRQARAIVRQSQNNNKPRPETNPNLMC